MKKISNAFFLSLCNNLFQFCISFMFDFINNFVFSAGKSIICIVFCLFFLNYNFYNLLKSFSR